MRKRIIDSENTRPSTSGQDWLNIEELAEVEITSEDAAHPIEHALLPGRASGWRAACPGKQTIRLVFAQPQQLKTVRIKFRETGVARTQEYVLRWSRDGGQSFREIVRQQWNFSPDGATEETEHHLVALQNVTVLELIIIPDTSGGKALASLEEFWVA